MILAAGLGTRLKKLTKNTPKPLIKINGKPLIEFAIMLIRRTAIKEVVINLHFEGSQIKNYLGNGSRYGLRFFYSMEKNLLGTGGGVKKAQSLLGNQSFVLINSDILCNINFTFIGNGLG